LSQHMVNHSNRRSKLTTSSRPGYDTARNSRHF
jgi:hypothetical protein